MRGDLPDLAAERSQTPASIDCLECREQLPRGSDRDRRRRFVPVKRSRRPRIPAPRDDIEQRRREIDAVDLGFPMLAEPIARVPQANSAPFANAPRAAGALIGRVRRNLFGHKPVDAALGVVPRHFVHA